MYITILNNTVIHLSFIDVNESQHVVNESPPVLLPESLVTPQIKESSKPITSPIGNQPCGYSAEIIGLSSQKTKGKKKRNDSSGKEIGSVVFRTYFLCPWIGIFTTDVIVEKGLFTWYGAVLLNENLSGGNVI